jgi:hypothetical protein
MIDPAVSYISVAAARQNAAEETPSLEELQG